MQVIWATCLSNLFTLLQSFYFNSVLWATSLCRWSMWNVFEIGFLLPAGTQNAAHNISYWSAYNNQLPLLFWRWHEVIQNCPTRNFRLKSPLPPCIKTRHTAFLMNISCSAVSHKSVQPWLDLWAPGVHSDMHQEAKPPNTRICTLQQLRCVIICQ